MYQLHFNNKIIYIFLARRRAAAKRKKLKNLGKSKSTDTEEEDADDDCGDDGELVELTMCVHNIRLIGCTRLATYKLMVIS